MKTMKTLTQFLVVFSISVSVTMISAQAAQNVKVIVDEAQVFDKPQPDAIAVGTVKKDQTIPVSNLQTNGFYKTRISGGIVGWISGANVLAGTPSSPKVEGAPLAPAPTPSEAPPPAAEKRSPKKKREMDSDDFDHSRILISGGMQILNNKGFPSQVPTDGSKTGYGGTLEMQFKLSSMVHLAGRAEYFSSSSTQTTTTGTAQSFKFHTLPLMVGFVLSPLNSSSFRLGIGAYGGMAVGTKLSIVQGTQSVDYASGDLCAYGNLQMAYRLSRTFGIYGEGGYRLHSASYPATTAASINAPAFTPDYGGVVARLGVELRF